MKKSLKIISAVLLFSSVVFSTATVSSIVHAEETVESTTNDTSSLREQLQNLVNQARAILATPELYTEDSIKRLETSVSNAQNALDHNLESSYATFITNMNIVLNQIVSVTPPSSTEPSSTEPSSTEPSSTEPSSTEPSSTEPSSTEPSSTEPSSTEPSSTEPSSTEPSSTEPSSTEPSSTEPSIPAELTPSITVSDQTMYVGQKLTEDMILSWATFNNADGYMVGFEVIGEAIQVTTLGNILVNTGTSTIRYYVSKPTRNVDTVVAEKQITLTVLPEDAKPVDPLTPILTDPKPEAPATVFTPVTNLAQKPIKSTETTAKKLPVTGESDNGMMIASAGIMLIAGAYIFRKKQQENN